MAISPFLKKEHSEIKSHFGQELIDYFDSLSSDLFEQDIEKEFFKNFIAVILRSCGCSQQTIVGSLKKRIDRSEISRKTEQLNEFLNVFSENRTRTPIQMFYHHLTAKKKKQKPGCHLARSEGKVLCNDKGNKIRYSYKVDPLEEVIDAPDHRIKQFKSKLKSEAIKHLKKNFMEKNLMTIYPWD